MSKSSLCFLEPSFSTAPTLFASTRVCVVCLPEINVTLSLFSSNHNNHNYEQPCYGDMRKRNATWFAVLADWKASQASLKSSNTPSMLKRLQFSWTMFMKRQRYQFNQRSLCHREKHDREQNIQCKALNQASQNSTGTVCSGSKSKSSWKWFGGHQRFGNMILFQVTSV